MPKSVSKRPAEPPVNGVHILARDNNERGDLFTNLIGSILEAGGYGNIRQDVSKTGREIDLMADHEVGGFKLRGECKAHRDPVGGDAINKFVGVIARERAQAPDQTVKGLFVSLSGYKDSALTQEDETPVPDLQLWGADHVVNGLVKSGLLCPPVDASFLAGRIASEQGLALKPAASTLIISRTGPAWIQYLGAGGDVTAAVLIHGDGEPLSSGLVQEIAELDKKGPRLLEGLECLPDPAAQPAAEEIAVTAYRDYVLRECGEIEMTGLSPELNAANRYSLESLFVPLKLAVHHDLRGIEASRPSLHREDAHDREHEADRADAKIGHVLAEHSRLVILGDPGSGKSTLLKRIAVAYADDARRRKISDALPVRTWTPIFIRCRQLRGMNLRSIDDVLRVVPEVAQLQDVSETLIDYFRRQIREGNALLLIDGLDEIPSTGDRIEFCRSIERFAAQYTACAFIVTSRIVGYREMGFRVRQDFVHATMQDFDRSDIEKYVASWTARVEEAGGRAAERAFGLLGEIFANPRVERLARNPLMLATLALIRQWVGALPKRRATLYSEAVQVLLVNWNREAHEPINLDEALPQLEFLSFWMMQNGYQEVNRKELLTVLNLARQRMPDVLANAKTSPPEFITAVEYRSSLLVEIGRRMVDGELVPVYEFRHLTFQEYLAAKAAVEGHVPEYDPASNVIDRLDSFIGSASWREVVPLAAVLSGRDATLILNRLIYQAQQELESGRFAAPADAPNEETIPSFELALLCLADEPNVLPDTVSDFFALAHGVFPTTRRRYDEAIRRASTSIYGPQLKQTLTDLIVRFRPPRIASQYGGVLGEMVSTEVPSSGPDSKTAVRDYLTALSPNRPKQFVPGALMAMSTAYGNGSFTDRNVPPVEVEGWADIARWLSTGLDRRSRAVRFSAAWALAWIFEHDLAPCPVDIAIHLGALAVDDRNSQIGRQSRWALGAAVEQQQLQPVDRWTPSLPKLSEASLSRQLRWAISHRANGAHEYTHDPVMLEGIATVCALTATNSQRLAVASSLRSHFARCSIGSSAFLDIAAAIESGGNPPNRRASVHKIRTMTSKKRRRSRS